VDSAVTSNALRSKVRHVILDSIRRDGKYTRIDTRYAAG
jgi:hypothetical protein